MKITLFGSPRTTNTLYATVCRGKFPTRFMSGAGKALKEDYQWQAKSQFKGALLTDFLEIDIKIYFKTNRKCDWDNFHKLSMDALTGIVWEDDSQIMKAHVEKLYDNRNPRIELTIKTL